MSRTLPPAQEGALRLLAVSGPGRHTPASIAAGHVAANAWNRLVGRGWASSHEGPAYSLTPVGLAACRDFKIPVGGADPGFGVTTPEAASPPLSTRSL